MDGVDSIVGVLTNELIKTSGRSGSLHGKSSDEL